jgi:hypothetical protein
MEIAFGLVATVYYHSLGPTDNSKSLPVIFFAGFSVKKYAKFPSGNGRTRQLPSGAVPSDRKGDPQAAKQRSM